MTEPSPHTYDASPYTTGDPYADYRGADLDFTHLVDLADRRLGAGVIAANDEFFAERENLLRPEPAVFDPHAFGHKGKVMDGWETLPHSPCVHGRCPHAAAPAPPPRTRPTATTTGPWSASARPA